MPFVQAAALSTPARLVAAVATILVAAAILPVGAFAAGDWPWPVEGEVLTAYRNVADPYAAGQHRGIDIGASEGQAVRAATGGTVTFVGTVGSSGAVVAIRTADGRFDTSYLHLGSIDVRAGDEVSTGDKVGAVGTSGVRSTAAAHLHFGVRAAGTEHAYRDPLRFLAPPGAPVPDPPAPVVAPVRAGPLPEAVPPRLPHPAARPARSPQPAAAPERGPAPERLPGPKGAFEPLPAPQAGQSPRPVPAPAPANGPPFLADVPAWAVACAGLLLAAALGRIPGGRRRIGGCARSGRLGRGSSAPARVVRRGRKAPLEGGTQVAG